MPATIATPEKKLAFAAALSATGIVRRACEAVGIDYSTAYRWRESDEEFAALWERAAMIGNEVLEDEARRRAFEGVEEPVFHQGVAVDTVRKYSDTLTIFLLKGAMPEKYRDRQDVNMSGKVSLVDLVAGSMAADEGAKE